MARRRMFSLDIVDTDAFLDMPLSSQALYFHLGMRADDDGFLANPKRILRDLGASHDDMKILLAKRFVLTFESGVVVIKHWKINNFIRADRYHATKWKAEKQQLTENMNGAYTEKTRKNGSIKANGIPKDNQRYTEDRVGKERLGTSTSFKGDVNTQDFTNTQDEEIDLEEVDKAIQKRAKN